MKLEKYQVMPDLSEKEYQELKDDIEARGVMVPIEYDDLGNVLDGHHRLKACAELGIKYWPRMVRHGLTEEEKKTHALVLNLARRHMGKEQRQELWAEMRKAGMTLEAIAEADGTVSEPTVRRALQTVSSNDGTDLPPTITGKDGKTYPTTKPRKAVFVSEEVQKKAEKLPEHHQEAVLSGNKKPMEAARDAKIEELSKTANLPNAKYRVVYADPPWSYGNTQPDYHTEQRDHYPVMSIGQICEMDISGITEKDAVLFIWVTSPILEESFAVIGAWGFKYKASFVWDKIRHNMGHYNSVRHEFLLICTKGSCQPDTRVLIDSVVSEERTGHSKKPNVFYEIIEKLYPIGKKIELFSRDKREGWDAFGNEM